MKKHILYILSALAAVVFIAMAGCSHSKDIDTRLDLAESLMETYPDSALSILKGINISDLSGRSLKARHALLSSMALDKNYIDTTTFDVLQPALDYYPEYGTPDEKLRTYYYQGVINKNAGNDDFAMQAWLNANELENDATDSLTLARLLVAQGSLYYKQYRMSEFVATNLKAANIFASMGKSQSQLRSYCRALDGEIILEKKVDADSIANICINMVKAYPEMQKQALSYLLRYYIKFGSQEDIKRIIHEVQEAGTANKMKMNLAHAYIKIGDAQTAMDYLDNTTINPTDIRDSLSYLSLKSHALEGTGQCTEALDYFRNYSQLLERFHTDLFSNSLLFSEKKHEMEIESLMKLQKRDSIIKLLFGGLALLTFIIFIFYFRNRLNKAARIIAEQETNNLRLAQENLRLELSQLKEERNRLNSLLEERKEMSAPMQEAIRMRLDMLNSLLAKEITDNDAYAKPYRKWIDSIRSDRKAFMQSTQLAFRASHPKFIKYLEEHSLTEDEINYVCLYALGLRGKEVGEYIQLKRHYNVSSEIRRKLGIDEHSANLGPYIRSLLDFNTPDA